VKTEILKILRGTDGYVSGQELCDKLGVSRTAVWKVIGSLKEEGYEIDSVSRKGYRLLSSPDVVSESEIASRISDGVFGQKVVSYEITDSTNTRAKQLAEEGAVHGTLVVANMQTAGKGRRGRSWQQEEGSVIAMSLLLRPTFSPDKASMLTLLAAHSVAGAIEAVTGLPAAIKWPNDIVINRKKTVGILTEMSLGVEQAAIDYIVIGIGINVNNTAFPEDIRDMATSLYLEKGERVSRSALIAESMRRLEADYEAFLKTEDLSAILPDYNAHLISMNKEVRVLDPKGEYTGISRGMDAQGELLVERADGEIIKVYAGEVSVRGLYGYV
jgi:BirA family transcriptional regulator, biotin operon repressor / biotin---[acetyl-CoA-carboxylase] ligase